MTEPLLSPRKIFLTAKWENLLMLNYEVPPEILQPYIPPFTEIDLWKGKALVSMVGFLFKSTRVFGVHWPLHCNFEEINLRLYVKHFDGKSWKRGVAFISEIVPRHVIAWMANLLYNEHYKAMPTGHEIETGTGDIDLSYEWKYKGRWNKLGAAAAIEPVSIRPDSDEEFIFEHFWGYNALNNKTTIEYGVEHPRWQVLPIKSYEADFDITNLYGAPFVPYLSVQPKSVFLAKGSAIVVRKPVKIMGS